MSLALLCRVGELCHGKDARAEAGPRGWNPSCLHAAERPSNAGAAAARLPIRLPAQGLHLVTVPLSVQPHDKSSPEEVTVCVLCMYYMHSMCCPTCVCCAFVGLWRFIALIHVSLCSACI